MKRLIFVGLGLGGPRDITLRGLDRVREADHVLLEGYTSVPSRAMADLEAVLGVVPTVMKREPVEDGSFLKRIGPDQSAVFLVWGDPMSATTHIDLLLRARKEGMEVEVVPNASVLTAVPGLLGLQHYKFGRTVTLVHPSGSYFPTSPFELMMKNREMGLHSLVLLDIDTDTDYYMEANEGLEILLESAQRVGKGGFSGSEWACVVARAGSDDTVMRCDRVDRLLDERFGAPPHSLVIPGKLHFMEAEVLVALAGAPDEIITKDD